MDKSSTPPMISVIMPIYNGELFLREAIDSILNQTYTNFEFIIIDDGSTDQTAAILNTYSDPRIIRITHPQNLGLVKSLNDGIAQARGEYFARMDADDISFPERFEKQIQFMNDHPEIGMLGGNVQVIDTAGNLGVVSTLPTTSTYMLWKMCFENPIRHPTVLMRTKIIKQLEGYRDFKASEDYDLWQRMSEITKLANLNDILVFYRLHGNNLSTLPNTNRTIERKDIKQRAITKILDSNRNIDWQQYWNDPYYSGIFISKILLTLIRKLLPSEKKIINKEAGYLLYKRARAISKDKSIQKAILFLYSFFLYPPLLGRFLKRNRAKNNV